jgi:hypothetical protein
MESEETLEAILERRARLRAEYGGVYDEVAALLFDADPIGINFGCNTDEYEPEVDLILPRLRESRDVADVVRLVHEIFLRMFDPECAGPASRYEVVAARVFEAWQCRRRA